MRHSTLPLHATDEQTNDGSIEQMTDYVEERSKYVVSSLL
jgi:hypothetical protein